MGLATTPQLWKNMHSFLHRVHPTINLAEVNDDLAGFFNSVPRQQILDSLSALIELYQHREYPRAHFSMSSESTQLRVSVARKAPSQRCRAHPVCCMFLI